MDGVHQVRLFRAPIWCSSGGSGTREAGGTVAESLVGRSSMRYRVTKHQIRRGRRTARSSTSQEALKACARKSKARTGKFLRGKLISGHGLLSSYEGQQRAANGQDSCGVFVGMYRALDSWMLARARLHQLKASTAMDLGVSIFLISA